MPAWQGIQMSSWIGLRRKRGQTAGNHARRCFDQLFVVPSRQQILTILVGLPWCVQDSGDEAGGVGGKERPEMAGTVQPVKRRGPTDRHVLAGVL